MTHIIGNGLIATSCRQGLNDDLDVTVFASGVSNLNASDPNQCSREQNLLQSVIADLDENHLLVYFGTCSIYDPDEKNSAYCMHKLRMEKIIQDTLSKSLILRLPQVVGPQGNPDNLINFLSSHIRNQSSFNLWKNAHRTLLNVNDISLMIKHLLTVDLQSHCVINAAPCQPVPVTTIVSLLEDLLTQKAKYQEINKGQLYQIDSKSFNQLLSPVFPVRELDYLQSTLATHVT